MRQDSHKALVDRTRGRQLTTHVRDGGNLPQRVVPETRLHNQASDLNIMSVGYVLESTPRTLPPSASVRNTVPPPVSSTTLPPVAELVSQFVPTLHSVVGLLILAQT